ncbi:MAG: MBL fold metallo-hydrolase RNA specificity domain-containing protein, partial [Minisyncoccales bacterium]
IIYKWKNMVKAIVPSHAHLDHIAAIPFLAKNYPTTPIITVPFASAVLKAILRDSKIPFNNEIIELNPNHHIKISNKITIEFINMTHSTPQTVMIALHTPYGCVLYGCDSKLDDTPLLGKKPNYERIKEIADKKVHKNGVIAFIADSTYSNEKKKTPSESVAKELLKGVLLGTQNENNLVIVTTFSSHLARIKSILEIAKQMNRKTVLLGRSLSKYIQAGIETNIFQLPKNVELVKYSSQIKKSLKKIKNRKNYLLIVTGHQGETKATLSKMVSGKLDFNLHKEDHVIFSCTVIPTESNIKNREELEDELKKKKVRIFKDIHVSGHGAKEDVHDLIKMTKAKKIIPAHGFEHMRKGIKELCLDMGYNNNDIIMIKDGETEKII